MTDRYAVVGHPVAHSKSPWIHAEFARACAQDLDYTRIEAPLEGFERTVEEFRRAGGKGLNVTVPFKEQAFRYCDRASGRAGMAEAVNTLAFSDDCQGDNTDGIGLVRDLSVNLGVELKNRAILLLGAGGAARGVVGALQRAGVSGLVIANRTVPRAQAIAARFAGSRASSYAELAGMGRFDVVVNATAAGLAGEAPPLPPGTLQKGMLAYDMVYGRDTPFLIAARAAGATACDGLGMLVEQAAESFFIWRGVRPDTGPVLSKLRGL